MNLEEKEFEHRLREIEFHVAQQKLLNEQNKTIPERVTRMEEKLAPIKIFVLMGLNMAFGVFGAGITMVIAHFYKGG